MKVFCNLLVCLCLLLTKSGFCQTFPVEVKYPLEKKVTNSRHGVHQHSEILVALADVKEHLVKDTDVETTEEGLVAVDQLIDNDTLDPSKMFRFAPDYVELQPGDSIRFMNSLGKHTVLSVDTMLPEGAEPFSISHKKVAEIRFDVPGIYGIRCKVHTRYGMVMLVKVGDDLSNLEEARKIKITRRAKSRFKALFNKLDASLAKSE